MKARISDKQLIIEFTVMASCIKSMGRVISFTIAVHSSILRILANTQPFGFSYYFIGSGIGDQIWCLIEKVSLSYQC